MPSLKEDIALATNLLGRDQDFCTLMAFSTKADKATRLVPMRQQPKEGQDKPLVCVWIKTSGNLGGPVTSKTLVVDIYTPLSTQRNSGVGYDIAARVREVLDKESVGRGLEWFDTEPDRRTTTGWHKATVFFVYRSTKY